ncbi:unnamed protein product [Chrysodeixis includens]|uniref:MICOS complex subunit MIC10 n=1 Tax=Chrysodeixis includens TaxID=689277 RepID=A0A9P0BYS1_CHRIL|nr:unnamed protein product [Chrysodeixis includens]
MVKGKKDLEDSYSTKLDMCLTDGIVKTASGIILGTVVSVFYFRQRRWPIVAGIGMGVGIAYANCEYELNPRKNDHH